LNARLSRNRLLLVMVIGLIGLVFAGTRAMSIEEPRFTVAQREGAIEVRDYPAVVVAQVTVTGDQQSAVRKGFRVLAAYIYGSNTRRQSIAMTAPVVQARDGEKIAMAAPVSQTHVDGAWVVRFTMPSRYSLEMLPRPNDARVMLRQIAPARFAVIRFSGIAGEANVATNTRALLAFVAQHHLRTIGTVLIAQYNPPWTLWFMRRNEVMIELAT